MRSWSIPAGKIFGAEVRIHLTFLVLLMFVWFTESAGHGKIDTDRGLALVAIIFGCVVMHELGHAVAGLHAGISAKTIILLPIGGVTLLDETRQGSEPAEGSWKRDIRIALAGPLINLLVAVVAGSILLAVAPEIHLWSRPWVSSGNLPRSLVWANVWLALFNVLPAYPLDGGKVLRSLLSRHMDAVRATRRAVSIGQTIATLLMLVGIWNLWLTLIGIFVFIGAQLPFRAGDGASGRHHVD
jgi:Zn-dependent protease